MTYITRIATKRILAKYFLYSLKINYLHWKLSASRSVFSCYATYEIYIISKSVVDKKMTSITSDIEDGIMSFTILYMTFLI